MAQPEAWWRLVLFAQLDDSVEDVLNLKIKTHLLVTIVISGSYTLFEKRILENKIQKNYKLIQNKKVPSVSIPITSLYLKTNTNLQGYPRTLEHFQ